MDAALSESGTYKVGKVFGGKFCVQIPLEDVQPGDYIQFYRQGLRSRQVKDIHRGRKHNYIQVEPSRCHLFKDQRVNFKDVHSVWRPDVEQRAAREG